MPYKRKSARFTKRRSSSSKKQRYNKRRTFTAVRRFRKKPTYRRTKTASWRGKRKSVASAYSDRMTTRRPTYVTRSKDSCTIAHRELIGNVVGKAVFTVDANQGVFPVNPGLGNSFPWLSAQASSWEKYRFTKLKYIYCTKTASTTIGTVVMAIDYDATEAAPTTESQMTSYYGCVEDSPWKEIVIQADLKRMHGARYIRSQGVGTNDLKTYDQGIMYLATVGCTDDTPLGKLWVEYEVELSIPQSGVPAGIGVYYSSVSSITNMFPVINNAIINSQNYNIEVQGDPDVPNRLHIKGLVIGKRYLFHVVIEGTVLTDFTSTSTFTPVPTILADNYRADATDTQGDGIWTFIATDKNLVFHLVFTATTVSQIASSILEYAA